MTIRGHRSINEKQQKPDVGRAQKTLTDLMARARTPKETENWTSRLDVLPVGDTIPVTEDCKIPDTRKKPTLSKKLADAVARLKELKKLATDPDNPDSGAVQSRYRAQENKLDSNPKYRFYRRQMKRYKEYQVDMKLYEQCVDNKAVNRRVTFLLRY